MKRWKLMDKFLYVNLGLLVLFAWFDSQNLVAIKQIDELWQNCALWSIFANTISPAAFTMWVGVLIAIGIIYYQVTKDKSEAVALVVSPVILIWFGVQDLIYYFFSPDTLAGTIGCWADVMTPVKIVSDFLGETCPTSTSFILTALIGIYISYKVYKYLREKY